MRTGPVQRLHGIKPLLLVGREKRSDLRVELLEHHVRLGSRFLMNRLELRPHGSYERFDLTLLRVGQLKRSRQHHGQVLLPVMARRIVGCLRAGELCDSHEGRDTNDDRNEFYWFHLFLLIVMQSSRIAVTNLRDTTNANRLHPEADNLAKTAFVFRGTKAYLR